MRKQLDSGDGEKKSLVDTDLGKKRLILMSMSSI
jgi:hypothetical protein